MRIPGYCIDKKIYETDRSLIYRAQRDRDGLPVVLKQLKNEYPSSEELARFRREYEMTCAILSDKVIKAYGLLPHYHTLVMVIEDFGGDSLSNIFKIRKPTLAEFLKLAIQVSDGLSTVHAQHIMHKDINPSNIVWNPETGQLKLIDFGISTTLSREQPESDNPDILEGTLPYISPEQTGRMNRAIDYRTDLYSLGASFYEMLTGQRPFDCKEPLEWVHAHIARTPVTPHSIRSDTAIPKILSDIIMTLMAKNAENRYQSASGLKVDLQRCLDSLEHDDRIEAFEMRQRDLSERLQIPQKLYGREDDIQRLHEAFERVAMAPNAEKEQHSELLLITGPAGIGKTSLIHELRPLVIEKHGYFISGKFEQFERNIPYSAIISAFHSLIRQILSEPEERIAFWQGKILQALGSNGQVIIDVIPELEYIIGKQAVIPELAPQESKNRFIYTFRQFLQTFACPKHPLVIFLDDLQWADASSLKLLESWMSGLGLRHTLILGAYRDNELDKALQLTFALDNLHQAGALVHTITLAPLTQKHVRQLLTDTLKREGARMDSLAELCFHKSRGNPFFLNQLLLSLYDSELLRVDRHREGWQWDLEQIQQAPIRENVVSLMAGKIQALPQRTQKLLGFAACIGTQFDLSTLAVVDKKFSNIIFKELWPVLQTGLILPLDNSYKYIGLYKAESSTIPNTKNQNPNTTFKFHHDRIQQAAYDLIEAEEREAIHLKIGRLLLLNISEDERREHIFDIVHHLNLGKELLKNQRERNELAELNLLAGKRAKASAAYQPAFTFLQVGLELLDEACWKRNYDLALTLHEEKAEAAYLCGHFDKMSQLVLIVQQKARTLLDKVNIYEIEIQSRIAQNMLHDAVMLGLQKLKCFGIEFPQEPSMFRILFRFLKLKLLLMSKSTEEELIELPDMTDPHKLATMRILRSIGSAAYLSSPKLLSLLIIEGINLSLKYGNCSSSAFAYGGYGLILCGRTGDIETGYRFGEFALKLLNFLQIEELGTEMLFAAFIRHWKKHAKSSLPLLRELYQTGQRMGNFEYAGFCASNYIYLSILTGNDLSELAQQTQEFVKFMVQLRPKTSFHHLEHFFQAILNLLGRTKAPCFLSGDVYDEQVMIPFHHKVKDSGAIFDVYFLKSYLCYLFQDYSNAIENSKIAREYIHEIVGAFLIPNFYFYDSLICLASYKKKSFRKRVAENQKMIAKWAYHAPMNYLHKWHLVEAERARILGKHADAIGHYDTAIELAKKHEYLNEEALANELAAKFYQSWGKEKIACIYMQEALYCYTRWGALAKVEHLKQQHPGLVKFPSRPSTKIHTGTTHTAKAQGLDLTTIMKAAQTISQSLDRDSLVKMLLERLIENTGAQKAVFIVSGKDHLQAEYFLSADETFRKLKPPRSLDESGEVAVSVVRYVARTREQLVLSNALEQGDFVRDEYVLRHQLRSLLCLPILYQQTLIGILYLEHRLVPDIFSFERQQVAYVLCAQIAISFELAKQQRTREKQEEERRRYEAVKAANQAKSEFLRTISHEIRNPLNAITLGLSNLNRQIDDPAHRQSYLKRIDASSQILQNLVNSVLDLSSIEASQFNLHLDSFNIRETVATAVEPFQFELKEDVEFAVNVDSNIPACLYGDGVRVTQVLANLVSNAVKFTESGSIVVNVGLSNLDPIPVSVVNAERIWLHFSVRDSGPGIPDEEQLHIFEPYFQGREILRHKSQGTGGIGMTIVKKIVNAMGGEISLQSHPGLGTRIHVILPFSVGHEVESVNQEDDSRNSLELSLRVLIAEDNHSNRFMLSDWLSSVGCQVTEAEDGNAALKCWRQEEFDVILMDKQMPGMDGIQATRKIRELEKPVGNHTHIIALTASATNNDKRRCLQAGMDDYLAKPIDMSALFHKLKTLFPEKEVTAEKSPGRSGGLRLDDEIESLFQLDNMPESWKHVPAKREKFITLIAGDIQQSLRRLEQAIQEGDSAALSKAAHKLKGAVGKLRSEKIQELVRQLEEMRWREDLEEASTRLKRLKSELERVLGGKTT